MTAYFCLGLGIISAVIANYFAGIYLPLLASLLTLLILIYLKYRYNYLSPYPVHCLILVFCLGYSYSALRINYNTKQLIREPISHLTIVGYLATPPTNEQSRYKAEFKVTTGALAQHKLMLFYPESVPLKSGHSYQLNVNLQPLNLNFNQYAFNYQQYLINNHISAFAYVNSIINDNGYSYAPSAILTRIRSALINYLTTTLSHKDYKGMIIALTVGYSGLIPDTHWKIFKNSGIMHLISISGLHITLVAALAGLIANNICRCFVLATPRQIISLWSGVSAALIYALIAGFSLPTQRAFYLLLISSYLITRRYYLPLFPKLVITAVSMLLIDPLAGLSSSFWLSFTMVVTIFSVIAAYPPGQSRLRFWITLQLAMLLVSLPISLYLFHTYPLVSVIANLWAIPLIGTLITPLLLITTLFQLSWGLKLVADSLNLVMLPLVKLATLQPYWQLSPDLITVLLCYSGIFLLLLPQSIPYKNIIGLSLIATVFAVASKEVALGHFAITTFSSNSMGISLISTKEHKILILMLNENNPRPELGFNLIPYLQAQHIEKIDYLVTNQEMTARFSSELHASKIEATTAVLAKDSLVDGVRIKVMQQLANLGIQLIDISGQITYIGNGYPNFNQPNWKRVILMFYPWLSAQWLYQGNIEQLILSYPRQLKAKINFLTDNLNLNANEIYDTTQFGSITLN